MSDEDVESRRLRGADELLGRIASILDAARGQVVRAVNHATVSAYWHIGREVVEALQRGNERATYGQALIEGLARRLTERYGKGFSATNLGYFRQFYMAYRDRIPHPVGEESQGCAAQSGIPHPVGGESLSMFHPNLSWSHYRALMRVSDADARRFYEAEAVRGNWSRRDLERQINSLYYQRILSSVDRTGMLQSQRQPEEALRPVDVLKDPYVLEFLDLPSTPQFHECELEDAIITRLQQHRHEGDNPIIGLILCSEKNEAVARYSVLHESQQLFASRYRFTLPSEEELQRELRRERALIESQMDKGEGVSAPRHS